jgi:hypothetical protein
MTFDFELNGKQYSMDLSAGLRVEIVRDLLKLWKEYCAANPNENIDFESYLNLVEKAPHPENIPVPPNSEDGDYIDEADLVALAEGLKRKDLMITVLLEALSKLK